MKISLEKIKAMILYFAHHTDPRFFGKTKLMKLFYFADFNNVKLHGSPITFDQYKNMEHGPVPMTIYGLMSTAASDPDESKLADILEVEKVDGMQKIKPLKKFEEEHRKLFSLAELTVLGNVSARFNKANKKRIEDASHLEHPWSDTEFLEDIPYSYASRDEDSLVTKEEIELAEKLFN